MLFIHVQNKTYFLRLGFAHIMQASSAFGAPRPFYRKQPRMYLDGLHTQKVVRLSPLQVDRVVILFSS